MFYKTLVLAAIASLAAAQSEVLSFSHVPNPVTDGQANAITYLTNDTVTPVTIILRKGQSGNLDTIETLTTSAQGGQYIWTPPTSLPNGIDYALEIKQKDQVNYYGPFIVQGYSGSSNSSSSASSGSSTITSSASSASATGGIIGTAGTSAGTGISMPRNTTMSMATLTAPATSSAASTGGAGFQTTSAASATGNAAPAEFTNMAGGALAAAIGLAAAFL